MNVEQARELIKKAPLPGDGSTSQAVKFIAAARTGWPEALDGWEAAEGEASELRERVADAEAGVEQAMDMLQAEQRRVAELTEALDKIDHGAGRYIEEIDGVTSFGYPQRSLEEAEDTIRYVSELARAAVSSGEDTRADISEGPPRAG